MREIPAYFDVALREIGQARITLRSPQTRQTSSQTALSYVTQTPTETLLEGPTSTWPSPSNHLSTVMQDKERE